MIVRRTLEICNQLVTEQAPETIRKLGTETKHPNMFWQSQRASLDKGLIVQINAPLRVIFGRSGPGAGGLFGSRAIPQAKPRTSETPNSPPAPGPHRGTKKRPCVRWIRMPGRGSLWLLPSGPDQIRNMSSSEPIERARRSVYITCSRPVEQDAPWSKGKPHECTATKRRGRKYATAPHQLLRREHSSVA